MTQLWVILLSTVLVNNVVLTRFLGLCPFLGVSRSLESAIGMAMATAFVLTLTSMLSWLIDTLLLVPFDLQYLRIVALIVAIAAVVQLTELIVRSINPLLHQMLGLFLPLIATNCVVLGVALLNVQAARTLLESAVFGIGAAAGFALVLIVFAAARERLAAADVPAAFRGAAIGLVTAGLMSMAFMGFAGFTAG
jgi:electron transport complex protein RnfA